MSQRRRSGVAPQKEALDEKYIPALKSSSEVEKGLDGDAQHALAGLWSIERKSYTERGDNAHETCINFEYICSNWY